MYLPTEKVVAIDTETTGLLWDHHDEPFAISFATANDKTAYVEWPVDPYTRKVQYDPTFVFDSRVEQLQEWFSDPDRTYVFHNAPFDLRMLRKAGIEVAGQIEDTSISMHTSFTSHYSYKLKDLAAKLGIMGKADEQQLQKRTIAARRYGDKEGWTLGPKVQTDYWMCRAKDPKDDTCKTYSIKDAERTIALWVLSESFLKEQGRWDTYLFEMRELFPVIERMIDHGLYCDTDVCDAEIIHCYRKRDALGKELRKLAGWEFDPSSDQQTKRYLFEGEPYKLTPGFYTKPSKTHPNGQPSSSQDSLELVAHEPQVAQLLEWRQWDKGATSFFIPYTEAVTNDQNSYPVIFPRFKQHGKKTRRLSVSAPNLQGVADDQGGRGNSMIPARKPFRPRHGHAWILIDYSQLETRTFAFVSGYDLLIDLLMHADLHTKTTEDIWGGHNNPRAIKAACVALSTSDTREAHIWLSQFDYRIVEAEASLGLKTSRNKGKPFFFTRMFGGGAKSISEKLHCPKAEARSLVIAYDNGLPGVIKFVRQADKEAKENHNIVETAYGTEIDVIDTYKASPYRVQGTAAELVKHAMIDCDAYLETLDLETGGMLLQIHDELIFEVPEYIVREYPQVVRTLKNIMETQADPLNERLDLPGRIDTPVEVKIVWDDGNWSRPEKWEDV